VAYGSRAAAVPTPWRRESLPASPAARRPSSLRRSGGVARAGGVSRAAVASLWLLSVTVGAPLSLVKDSTSARRVRFLPGRPQSRASRRPTDPPDSVTPASPPSFKTRPVRRGRRGEQWFLPA